MTDTEHPLALRLLSCNILAGARVQRYHEYFTRSWASVLPTRTKLNNLDSLARLLDPFDVIGLQEADAGSLRSGFRNQTRYLAEAAGMPYWCYQPNRPIGRLAHTANGLISRLQPSEVLDYPLPGRIPGRGVLLASFSHGEETLAVAIAHLSLGTQARARQLAFIAELLSSYPHTVLMGDLNTDANSPEMRQLFRHTNLQPPTNPTPTFPSWRPQRAIDHILTSSDITLERVWTLSAAFSDHLPLAAEIRLPSTVQQIPAAKQLSA
ncbi:MAG TPA: endonuclease/exonuclease/phosphatase family protein [Oleiagrimonas sp.]|nr:endonuclease/exonuclease/phosphatase family protein [Oleiagrimonas sp.]